MNGFSPAPCVDNNGITHCVCEKCGQTQSHARPVYDNGNKIPFSIAVWHHRCGVQPMAAAMPPTSGPGTELKKLLSKVGITATPNCSCNARARTMDANGCEWCEAHLDEIVGWLREEATNRRLPFLDAAGRVLVRRAIANARKEAARAEKAANAEGSEAEAR